MKKLLDNKNMLALIAVGVLMTAGSVSAHVGQKGRSELSDEQKQALEQIKELREDGDFEAIKILVEENDLHFLEKGYRGGNEDTKIAVENNNYSAFVSATENAPFADQVTEEFFARMVQAHNLRESGDHEGAREIMMELGIKPGHKKGSKMNREAFQNLTEEQKAVIAQAKELHEAGDHEGARELVESLGLRVGPRK